MKELIEYQVQIADKVDMITIEMLMHNMPQMEHILKTEINIENGEICSFVYHIHNLVSLREYLSAVLMDKERFILIAQGIIEAVGECRNYMIPQEEQCRTLENIYLDAVQMQIYVQVLPLRMTGDHGGSLAEILSQIIENASIAEDRIAQKAEFIRLYHELQVTRTDDDVIMRIEQLGRSEESITEKQETAQTSGSKPAVPSTEVAVQWNESSEVHADAPGKSLFPERQTKGILSRLGKIFEKREAVSVPPPGYAGEQESTHVPMRPSAPSTIIVDQNIPKTIAYICTMKERVRIDPQGIWVGRSESHTNQEIQLNLDYSPYVTRKHARLYYDYQAEKYFIVDESLSGTRINGKRLIRGEAVALQNGSQIMFADVAADIEIVENVQN